MDNQFIIHVLRNPQDYTDSDNRVVRNAAAERIEKLATEIDAMQNDLERQLETSCSLATDNETLRRNLERYMQIANSMATEIDTRDA